MKLLLLLFPSDYELHIFEISFYTLEYNKFIIKIKDRLFFLLKIVSVILYYQYILKSYFCYYPSNHNIIEFKLFQNLVGRE